MRSIHKNISKKYDDLISVITADLDQKAIDFPLAIEEAQPGKLSSFLPDDLKIMLDLATFE